LTRKDYSALETGTFLHIQFFNKRAVYDLVKSSKGIILKSRLYRPRVITREDLGLKASFKIFLSGCLFLTYKLSGSFIVSTHYAVLIKNERNSILLRKTENRLARINCEKGIAKWSKLLRSV
jgi:hypothetical protein